MTTLTYLGPLPEIRIVTPAKEILAIRGGPSVEVPDDIAAELMESQAGRWKPGKTKSEREAL